MRNPHTRHDLNKMHSCPLPLCLSGDAYNIVIPHVIPYNPLSLVYLFCQVAFCVLFRRVPRSRIAEVEVHGQEFKVFDQDDMQFLWSHGFFGKGSFSRSEPTYKERLAEKTGGQISMEELTHNRRMERKKFKSERKKLQDLEILARMTKLLADDALKLQSLRAAVNKLRTAESRASYTSVSMVHSILGDVMVDIEYLELQPVEVFFLYFALNCVSVLNIHAHVEMNDLFSKCCSVYGPLQPQNTFILHYVTYHHFRSLGWCVRLGIKFGCDMLLYKRGPPFSHAEYAVNVLPNDKSRTSWLVMSTVARVVGTVKKNFVLVFVDYPNLEMFAQCLAYIGDEKEKFSRLFQEYSITEVLYKRWSPARTRE